MQHLGLLLIDRNESRFGAAQRDFQAIPFPRSPIKFLLQQRHSLLSFRAHSDHFYFLRSIGGLLFRVSNQPIPGAF